MKQHIGELFRSVWLAMLQLGGARIVGQGIALLAIPIIASLYGPEAIGIASAVIAVSRVLSAGGGAGYHLALPLVSKESDSRILLQLACGIVLGAAILLSAASPLIVRVVGAWVPNLWYAMALNLLFVFGGLTACYTQYYIRCRSYSRLAVSFLANPVVSYAAIILFGQLEQNALAYLAGFGSGSFCQYLILKYGVRTPLPRSLTAGSGLKMRYFLRRFRAFLTLSWTATTLNAAGSNAAVLTVTALYGSGAAGLFALAERIALSPVALVGQSFSQIYVGELAHAVRKEPSRIFFIFSTSLCLAAVPATVISAILYFGGPIAVKILLSDEWAALAEILEAFGILVFFRLIASAVGRVFTVLEHQSVALWWNVGRLIATVSCFYITSKLNFQLTQSIWVFSSIWAVIDLIIILLAGTVAFSECRKRSCI